jgi:hypothetical protein
MLTREYRKLNDEGRMFAAMYGISVGVLQDKYTSPVAQIAAYFAGISYMDKEEFVRVMNGAGKALLRMGIDCRTDAERVRHQLHQIKSGAQKLV